MCIVDDGSSEEKTICLLKKINARSHRVKLHLSSSNSGISHATNLGLEMAKGDYIAFLDHDDRLSPDALFNVAAAIRQDPKVDILYSDRDMLSPGGLRYMHMFKPDWSPETLFSFNYICHFMIYRRSLVESLHGIRQEFEGSQDYDLILRAMELDPPVIHIPKVLYHWRQNEQSVALNFDSKKYAWEAGVRALRRTLERRGLKGEVSEIENLWRGHYRVKLQPPPNNTYCVIRLHHSLSEDTYTEFINQKIDELSSKDYVIVIRDDFQYDSDHILEELVSWFQVPKIGMVTGKIVDTRKRIIHAGIVHRTNGIPLSSYEGFKESEPGYMAVTSVVRNVSSPHPYCFAIRHTLWNELGGLDPKYKGPYSVFDLALRALNKGYRIVYTPFSRFKCEQGWQKIEDWPVKDRRTFSEQWFKWLTKGDPYYNRWLTLEREDMGLNLDVPPVN